MRKRVIAIAITLTAFTCSIFNTNNVFASNVNAEQVVNGDASGDVQYQFSDEELKAIEERDAQIALELAQPGLRSGNTNKSLAVTAFKQQNGYYCGPATTKQVLHYLKGSSETQSDYAKKLGTTTAGTIFDVIKNVLNNEQKAHKYVYAGISTNAT